ncbi:hypothetical protein ACTU44_21755 (plasmid) [Thalassospira sp. SM2505]
MEVDLNPILEDGKAAIVTLNREAKKTRDSLAALDQVIKERRLPDRPTGDDMRKLPPAAREAILHAYAQDNEDRAKQSGMRKRLDFIEREIAYWQKRIAAAQKNIKQFV